MARHPYSGVKTKINKHIEKELLHLTFENFSKILILPQGEFQRFLEEDSIHRGQILEDLFPVDYHRQLVKIASQQARDSRAEVDSKEVEVKAQRGACS